MQYYVELTNSEIAARIGENIHSAKYREIMRLKLIDGLTAEKIAELKDMSAVQIYRIVKRCKKLIEK